MDMEAMNFDLIIQLLIHICREDGQDTDNLSISDQLNHPNNQNNKRNQKNRHENKQNHQNGPQAGKT